jgi:hypothetical protein
MTELGDRNYALIVRGVKSCGSFDPNEILYMFEEQLYVHEADTIIDFLLWVHTGKQVEIHGMMMSERAFGSGNYEEKFQEFLKDKAKKLAQVE